MYSITLTHNPQSTFKSLQFIVSGIFTGITNKNDHYSLLTERAPDILATSFCRIVGLTALRAPAAAFDTALNIMAGQVR